MTLEEEKHLAYVELRKAARKVELLAQMKCDAETEFCKHKIHYQSLDRKLAMRDGRYVKLDENGNPAKAKKSSNPLESFLALPIEERLVIANALKDLNEGLLQ